MGTHGHGAVMHMLMGNVAERVVRSAPCPVLTVREPKEKEPVQELRRRGLEVCGSRGLDPGGERDARAGSGHDCKRAGDDETDHARRRGLPHLLRELPRHHGARRRPARQRHVEEAGQPHRDCEAQRRSLPIDLVFRTIDGRQPVRGHGGPDMPVWGDAFSKSREAGDAERVKA